MLITKPVTDLFDAFSSPDPTPGGGSASALAGALAASLLAMVAGMPKTRTGTADERAALDESRADLLRLRTTLLELVDRDAAAYDLVVAAFKRPKATDEEKADRKTAIREAMRVATDVPLETMGACGAVISCARVVAEHGNRSASSDVGVALHLAKAGQAGARLNVEINLGSLGDDMAVGLVTRERDRIADAADRDWQVAAEAAGLTARG